MSALGRASPRAARGCGSSCDAATRVVEARALDTGQTNCRILTPGLLSPAGALLVCRLLIFAAGLFIAPLLSPTVLGTPGTLVFPVLTSGMCATPVPSENLGVLACYAIQQAAFLTSLGREVVCRECDGDAGLRQSAARLFTSLGIAASAVGAVAAVAHIGLILPHGLQPWTLTASPLLVASAGAVGIAAWASCWLCAKRETRGALRRTACKLLWAQAGRVSACIAAGYAIGMILVIAVPVILLLATSSSIDCPERARADRGKLWPLTAPPGRPNRLPWGMNATDWQAREFVVRGLESRWMLVSAASVAVAALGGMIMLDIQASVAQSRRGKADGAAAKLGRAIAYISHEARGPLNAAALSLALLEMDLSADGSRPAKSADCKHPAPGEAPLDESVLEDLGTSILATQRHLDDLLVWQRVTESGQQALAPDLVPVWSNVSRRVRCETARTFGSLFRSQNVALRATGDGTSEQVWVVPADGGNRRIAHISKARAYVDMTQVMSIVSNSVSNALKHVPTDGSASVTVIAAVDASSSWRGFGPPASVPPRVDQGASEEDQQQLFRGLLRIEVFDTGQGISNQLLTSGKLFQPFARLRQGDDSLTMTSSGLGLAIVRTIAVDTLGGEVGLCSAEGQGTVAFATIPVWCSQPHKARQMTARDSDASPTQMGEAVTSMASELAHQCRAGNLGPGLEATVADSEASGRSERSDSLTGDPSIIAVGVPKPWRVRQFPSFRSSGTETSPKHRAGMTAYRTTASAVAPGLPAGPQASHSFLPQLQTLGMAASMESTSRAQQRSWEALGHERAGLFSGTALPWAESMGSASAAEAHTIPATPAAAPCPSQRPAISIRVMGAGSGDRPSRCPSPASHDTHHSPLGPLREPGIGLPHTHAGRPAALKIRRGSGRSEHDGGANRAPDADRPTMPPARTGGHAAESLFNSWEPTMTGGEARLLPPSPGSSALGSGKGKQFWSASQLPRKAKATRARPRELRAAEGARAPPTHHRSAASEVMDAVIDRSAAATEDMLSRATVSAGEEGVMPSLQRTPSALVTVVEDGKLTGSEMLSGHSHSHGHSGRMPGIRRGEDTSAACRGSVTNALRAAKSVAGGRVAFVVDDERVNRYLMAALVRRAGFAVRSFDRGETAVEALEAHSTAGSAPALLILDLSMPGIGGHGVLKRLRSLRESSASGPHALAGLVTIVVTDHASASQRAEAEAMGPAQLLLKPINAVEVLTAVAQLLR